MPTPILTSLFSFNGQDGAYPYGGLFVDASGDLFGTTNSGVEDGSDDGTVFELSKTAGNYSGAQTLVNFNGQNGAFPFGGLIADTAGDLFGTTNAGGSKQDGSVFEVAKTSGIYLSTPVTLTSFTSFNGPMAGLIADTAGDLFGTTAGGGAKADGTVFEITKTSGVYAPNATTLASFSGGNGSTPNAGLTTDAAGDLFGTTTQGGAFSDGTVFELAKTGGSYASAPATLVSFNGADGEDLTTGLITDAAGDLFGTTNQGGADGDGTVFEIAKTAGVYATTPTVLLSFFGQDGEFPGGGLIADSAGDLYGTTEGGGANGDGTVFELVKSGAGYASTPTILVNFNGAGDGAEPNAGLAGDTTGDLFGTTSLGGANGDGTVFELTGTGFQTTNTTLPPMVTSVTASPTTGNLAPNTVVTLTVNMSEAVTVSNDAPSLTLNDGGSAAYDAVHSTATALVFDYTVQSGQSTTALAVTGLSANGATIQTATGSAAVFTGVAASFTGLEINIPVPTVASVTVAPAKGDLLTSAALTMTVTMTEAITISGGIPTLSLNDNGVATYDAGKSTSTALVFDYTVQSAETTTALAVTGFNANGATIRDATGNNASFTAAPTTFTGLAINNVLASVASVVPSPTAGNVITGAQITLTVTMSEAVAVAGGAPSLTLNDGGTATYNASQSTTTALVFDYVVLTGQTVAALAVTAFNANGATIQDPTGNGAVMTAALATFSGLEVNVPVPAVASVVASPGTGDVLTGASVTVTVTMTKPVTVTGGTPSLTLNDGGSAIYNATLSSTTALVFNYFVQPGQTTTALALTGLNVNGATIQDTAGNIADISGATGKFAGLEINVAALTVPTITGTEAGQTTTDLIALSPFADVVIADVNAAQTEIVSVTASAPANGVLTNLGGGAYNAATGVYTDTGSAAAVSAALEELTFTPTAHQVSGGQTVTTGFTIQDTDTAAQSATDSTTSVVTTETSLLTGLSVSQQLELIYIAYFNRSADGGGYAYWEGQNVQAQDGGENAATAVTNIANAFAPQVETILIYPFLGMSNVNLNSPTGQAGLSTFIDSVYANLFDRAADPAGVAYWVGQISGGAVALGAAALAIANGANGSDAIEVQNKITVALDFTTRTASAGLGNESPLTSSLLAAARNVLSGVDQTALNDASVTAGMSATTAYISSVATGETIAATGAGSIDANVMTITNSDQLIDPGVGNHTIQFLPGTSADTLVLHANGVDQVSGFDVGTDVLDVRSLLTGTGLDLAGTVSALSNYLTVVDQGADALLRFDPTGQGGGSTVAVLGGLGGTINSLDSLVAHGAIRMA